MSTGDTFLDFENGGPLPSPGAAFAFSSGLSADLTQREADHARFQ
jgi:hypothetical protein